MNSISTLSMLIMSIVIGYVFAYPMYQDMDVLKVEKDARQASLDTIIHIEEKKTELAAQFAALSDKNKKDIDTILPDNFDYVRLTSHIDSVAKKYNIVIREIKTQDLSPSDPQTIGEASAQRSFDSGTIGFTFKASYESFQSFLGELEKSLRILDVRSLKIVPGSTNIYEYTIQFETYWL